MEVAKLIWKSWNEGKKLDSLSERMKPNSRKEAYKIQEQIEIISENKILGWKIAATSKDGQNHIGVSGPLAGRIFKDKAKIPNSNLILGSNQMAVAEPEFAFKIGTAIKPNKSYYKVKEVMEFYNILSKYFNIDGLFASDDNSETFSFEEIKTIEYIKLGKTESQTYSVKPIALKLNQDGKILEALDVDENSIKTFLKSKNYIPINKIFDTYIFKKI